MKITKEDKIQEAYNKMFEAKDNGKTIQAAFKTASMSVDKYVKTKMGKDNIHYRNINKSLKEIKDELSKVVGLEL